MCSPNKNMTVAYTGVTFLRVCNPTMMMHCFAINAFWSRCPVSFWGCIYIQTLADEKYCSSLITQTLLTLLSLTKYTPPLSLSDSKYQYRHVINLTVHEISICYKHGLKINPNWLVLQFFNRIEVTVILRPWNSLTCLGNFVGRCKFSQFINQ